MLQFLGVAAFYDHRFRKIPNAVIGTALCFGLVLQTFLRPAHLGSVGLYLIRFILTIFVLLPVFYYFKAGAGDLKLIALVIAYQGVGAGMQILLPGFLVALCWHALGLEESPLGLAVFLGAVPSLVFQL